MALKTFLSIEAKQYHAGKIKTISFTDSHPIGQTFIKSVSDYFPRISNCTNIILLRPYDDWSNGPSKTQTCVSIGNLFIPIWVENVTFQTIDENNNISSFPLEVGIPLAFDKNIQYRFINSDYVDKDSSKIKDNNLLNFCIFATYETMLTQNVEQISFTHSPIHSFTHSHIT